MRRVPTRRDSALQDSFPRPGGTVVVAIGTAQIFAWGSSYYLLGGIAQQIAAETGWPLAWTVAGLSVGLLVAGLVSPHMGRAVAERGGKRVLAYSTLALAGGLLAIANAQSLVVYLLGWSVMGLGMGTGLYDAAFAALGRHFGEASRRPITALTLIAGFSSTVTWPLSTVLLDAVGWRGVCLAYAGIEIAICLPLYLIFAPGAVSVTPAPEPLAARATSGKATPSSRTLHILAATFTLTAAVTAIMSVNLIVVITALGVEKNAAVALAALLGPAQVAARLVEMIVGRRYHPVLTLVLATGSVAAGIAMLLAGPAAALPAIVIYGGGIGVAWVARGTVPMAIFGPEIYAVQVGRIARPALIAQALAPTAGAFMLQEWGIAPTLAVLSAAALSSCALSLALVRTARANPPAPNVG